MMAWKLEDLEGRRGSSRFLYHFSGFSEVDISIFPGVQMTLTYMAPPLTHPMKTWKKHDPHHPFGWSLDGDTSIIGLFLREVGQ